MRLAVAARVTRERAECEPTSDSGDVEMRKQITGALLGLVLLFGGAATSRAEVRRVQMHIAGYLCGN
jgi:hypothetical protein